MFTKGFTLLELLVATLVLSTGIIVSMQALSFCGKVAAISLDTSGALFLAENKMQEWEFNEKQGLVPSGVFDDEGVSGRYEWYLRLRPHVDPGLQNLDLKVAWSRAQRDEELGFETCLRK